MPQRYQKEIEEILGQVDENPSVRSGSSSGRQQRRWEVSRAQSMSYRAPRERFRFTIGKALLAGVILLVISPLFGSLSLMAPIAFGGIAFILGAYVVYFTKPRRALERRWRGQSIEDEPVPHAFSRMWRWLSSR